MKKTIAILLIVSLLPITSACSSKQPVEQETDHPADFSITAETQDSITAEAEGSTDSTTSQTEETTSAESDAKTNSQAEQTERPKSGTASKRSEPVNPPTVSERTDKSTGSASKPKPPTRPQQTDKPTESASEPTVETPETSSEPVIELPEQPKEEDPVKQAQFYITAQGTTFTADFADNDSADALRDLLHAGDLTIRMSDYGSFEKVGSIGTSLPRKDTQISTTTGDVVLYQGDQIVIFYGTNHWSYSRLGKMDGVTAEALLSAFGSGDVTITFSLTKP